MPIIVRCIPHFSTLSSCRANISSAHLCDSALQECQNATVPAPLPSSSTPQVATPGSLLDYGCSSYSSTNCAPSLNTLPVNFLKLHRERQTLEFVLSGSSRKRTELYNCTTQFFFAIFKWHLKVIIQSKSRKQSVCIQCTSEARAVSTLKNNLRDINVTFNAVTITFGQKCSDCEQILLRNIVH